MGGEGHPERVARSPHIDPLPKARSQATSFNGATRSGPRNLAELQAEFPGSIAIYQAATITSSFRLTRRCAQVIVAANPDDHQTRRWEYVDTFSRDPDGGLRLVSVDITPLTVSNPSSDNPIDDTEFYECLKREREALGLRLPPLPGVAWPESLEVFETGRFVNGAWSRTDLKALVESMREDLADTSAEDPYRTGIEETLGLFQCYLDHGYGAAERLACLQKYDGVDP